MVVLPDAIKHFERGELLKRHSEAGFFIEFPLRSPYNLFSELDAPPRESIESRFQSFPYEESVFECHQYHSDSAFHCHINIVLFQRNSNL